MTLYELTNDFLALQEMLETDEIDEQVVKDTLESVEYELEEKAESIAIVLKNLDAESQALKTEMDRLKSRKQVLDNNKDRLKKALESSMIATGKTEFKTKLFSFGIQKNPISVKFVAGSGVPDDFLKIKKEVDILKIKNYLTENNLTECEFARLEQSQSLRIR